MNRTEERLRVIAQTSSLGIGLNLVIAVTKCVVGALTDSIAIVSEGVNNAADALTSMLTLIGAKLARRKPDEKHPFGYGRIEYLSALVVAVLILISGFEMLKCSIELLLKPVELLVSWRSLVIVLVSAIVKFAYGLHAKAMGRKVESTALEAVGVESQNDAYTSVVTIFSVAVFLIWGRSIDAYAGIVASGLILKAGIDVLRTTISELIGRPGDQELASRLYRMIRRTDGVLNAADMMLHNYGPGAWSGSVNVEIDHECSVGEVYARLHELQLRIMHEEHVTMVFGVYAVDTDHEETRAVRAAIEEFVRSNEHIRSFHAVYLEPETGRIYSDLVVDYKQGNWESLRESYHQHMRKHFPNREFETTVETEFV